MAARTKTEADRDEQARREYVARPEGCRNAAS